MNDPQIEVTSSKNATPEPRALSWEEMVWRSIKAEPGDDPDDKQPLWPWWIGPTVGVITALIIYWLTA